MGIFRLVEWEVCMTDGYVSSLSLGGVVCPSDKIPDVQRMCQGGFLTVDLQIRRGKEVRDFVKTGSRQQNL